MWTPRGHEDAWSPKIDSMQGCGQSQYRRILGIMIHIGKLSSGEMRWSSPFSRTLLYMREVELNADWWIEIFEVKDQCRVKFAQYIVAAT